MVTARALILLGVSLVIAACGSAPPLQVGFAAVDVSPTTEQITAEERIFMGAYGIPFIRWAEGVHDPVYARAMVIQTRAEAGTEPVTLALVVLDLPGVGQDILRQLESNISAELGISPDQVLVGATHSHSAPDLQGLWGGVPLAYRNALIAGATQAAVTAFESRELATLWAGSTQGPNHNRRGWEDTDGTLTTLVAESETGEHLGILVNFAAHPVILGFDNRLISRDFPGYVVDQLERELGGTALFFNGVVGDASPTVPPAPDGEPYLTDFHRAEAYGQLVAQTAIAATQAQTKLDGPLWVRTARWEQEVSNVLFIMVAELTYYSEGLQDPNRPYVPLRATAFGIGEQLQGISFPGEALTRLGQDIKSHTAAPYVLFLGLTCESVGYFIPGDEWLIGRNDNYEEAVSLHAEAGDKARAAIVPLLE